MVQTVVWVGGGVCEKIRSAKQEATTMKKTVTVLETEMVAGCREAIRIPQAKAFKHSRTNPLNR